MFRVETGWNLEIIYPALRRVQSLSQGGTGLNQFSYASRLIDPRSHDSRRPPDCQRDNCEDFLFPTGAKLEPLDRSVPGVPRIGKTPVETPAVSQHGGLIARIWIALRGEFRREFRREYRRFANTGSVGGEGNQAAFG